MVFIRLRHRLVVQTSRTWSGDVDKRETCGSVDQRNTSARSPRNWLPPGAGPEGRMHIRSTWSVGLTEAGLAFLPEARNATEALGHARAWRFFPRASRRQLCSVPLADPTGSAFTQDRDQAPGHNASCPRGPSRCGACLVAMVDEVVRLKHVRACCPDLDALTRHIRSFATMLAERRGAVLPDWLTAVTQNDLPRLHALASGTARDRDAVITDLPSTEFGRRRRPCQPGPDTHVPPDVRFYRIPPRPEAGSRSPNGRSGPSTPRALGSGRGDHV